MLNLWQKNDVFGMDIIQPLLDMATAPVLPVFENGTTVGGKETLSYCNKKRLSYVFISMFVKYIFFNSYFLCLGAFWDFFCVF